MSGIAAARWSSASTRRRVGRDRVRAVDAERLLARLGIHAYYTGKDPGDHPFYAWIRVGLQIYERLALEYPLYRGGDVIGHAAEIFLHASAALLASSLPARDQKEPFRRKVLREHGVAEEDLPTLDLVDAALAALTGLIALDGRHSAVGDPEQGITPLPVPHASTHAASAGGGTGQPSDERTALSTEAPTSAH